MLVKTSKPIQRAFDLSVVKEHLRVDQDVEDSLLSAYLDSAIEECASYAGRAINQQEFQWQADAWPCEGLIIPLAPIVSIVDVKYRDEAGTLQTMDEADWYFRRTPSGGVVETLSTFTRPLLATEPLPALLVNLIAGYDADDGSSGTEDPELEMPAVIRQAVLLTVGHYYQNRESVQAGGQPVVLPRGAEFLLDTIRIYR